MVHISKKCSFASQHRYIFDFFQIINSYSKTHYVLSPKSSPDENQSAGVRRLSVASCAKHFRYICSIHLDSKLVDSWSRVADRSETGGRQKRFILKNGLKDKSWASDDVKQAKSAATWHRDRILRVSLPLVAPKRKCSLIPCNQLHKQTNETHIVYSMQVFKNIIINYRNFNYKPKES